MNVLYVTPTFYPAVYWGGPIFSTYGLCNAISAIPGVALKVLTTDSAGPAISQRVMADSDPVVHPNGYEVRFTRRIWGTAISPGQLMRLPSMIRWADVVHLTGTYSFPTIPTLLLTRLFSKPLVWSPRGALQRWEGSSKPRLKRLWEIVCNSLLQRERAVLHVTSDNEGDVSATRIPKARVALIPNGVDVPKDLTNRMWCPGGNLRLIFLGRLDPIKGLENLLKALELVSDCKVSLDVYGTGEDSYLNSLLHIATKLGVRGRVTFRGQLDLQDKARAFAEADLCVSPSFSENFGMTVAEALAHAVPVIASTGTPWRELRANGCGWWVDNSPESLAACIREAVGSNLSAMGERGRAWMQNDYSWPSKAQQVYDLYQSLISSK